MQRFLVTVALGSKRKTIRCCAHKSQLAAIAAAKLHWGWFVIDVTAVGPGRRGSRFTPTAPRRWVNPGSLAVPNPLGNLNIRTIVLIPSDIEVRKIRADLAQRQARRIEAHLTLIDIEESVQQAKHRYAVDEYRKMLAPYLQDALVKIAPTSGMLDTLRRHRLAQQQAQDALHKAEGLLPPM